MDEIVEDFAGPLSAIIAADMQARSAGSGKTDTVVKLAAGTYTLKLDRNSPNGRFMSPPVSRDGGMAIRAIPDKDKAAADEERSNGRPKVRGIASSTSVDWYGTEMSRDCLEDMGKQFAKGKGVAYLPRHRDGWSMLEWNRQYGVTVGAEIEDRDVVGQHPDNKEQPCVLWVESELWEDIEGADDTNKLAKELRSRLERGQAIGQSIGGYFREVTYTVDEDGWITRIVINAVDLDHLATTRSPANPDSTGLQVVRSKLSTIFESVRSTQAPVPQDPAQRDAQPVIPLAPAAGVDNTPATPSANEPDQEFAMTQEEKDALLREFRSAIIEDVRSILVTELRAAAPAPATPAPAATPPAPAADPKLVDLENSINKLTQTVTELAGRSQPVGGGAGQPVPQERVVVNRPEDLIERAKQDGGKGAKFATFVEKSKESIFVDDDDRTSEKFARAVHTAKSTLAALLNRALDDGLVTLADDVGVGI